MPIGKEMIRKKLKRTNKKPYLPPEVQAFQSLKEITLAITCNCDYWGNADYDFCNECDWTGGKQVACPLPPDCGGGK